MSVRSHSGMLALDGPPQKPVKLSSVLRQVLLNQKNLTLSAPLTVPLSTLRTLVCSSAE